MFSYKFIICEKYLSEARALDRVGVLNKIYLFIFKVRSLFPLLFNDFQIEIHSNENSFKCCLHQREEVRGAGRGCGY